MKYIIKNIANPSYCGVDAGSVQFANGKAIVEDVFLAEWYRTHEGYKVEEEKAKEEAKEKAKAKEEEKKAREEAKAKEEEEAKKATK